MNHPTPIIFSRLGRDAQGRAWWWQQPILHRSTHPHPITAMEDNAMDWHPTTPPPPHNPYSHPQYVPGGWPKSPPSHRITSGIFAKRKEPGFAERAGKRICRGIKAVGRLAACPVKPIYIIIRRLRERQRTTSNRTQRTTTRNRAHTPALRARLAAAESRVVLPAKQRTPRQAATPPTTPPFMSGALHIDDVIQEQRLNSFSPTASSVTNTETFIETPSTIRSTDSLNSKNAIAGIKRRRNQEQQQEKVESSAPLYTTLQSYLAARAAPQQPTPQPDTPPSAKRMKPNPFNADYKRSPILYGARGVRSSLRVNAIGSKLQNAKRDATYFGGWEFAKPIELETRPITPDEQLQLELGSYLSDRNREVEENEEKNKEKTRALADGKSKSEGLDNKAELAQSDKAEIKFTKVGPGSKLRYDEQWTMSRVRTVVINEDQHLPVEKRYHTSRAPPPASESTISATEKLFYPNKSLDTPPPVRSRIVGSSSDRQPIGGDDIKHEVIGNDNDEHKEFVGLQDSSAKIEAEAEAVTEETKDKSTDSSAIPAAKTSLEVKSENSLLAPLTPLKVIAEKPATKQEGASAQVPETPSLKTPLTKLSKLSIDDVGDKDTPKATPHSGSKTVRVTRYREAIEKAQKAKLEQYEIIPITAEWDKKVRSAVRTGIPNYLGPHDLARVVPQYASHGQDNWLNDETINKYLELVAVHGRKNDRPDQVPSHHAFNNFFYNNLRDKGALSVSRWSKRAKIGGKSLAYVEKVFVPINSGAHWTLAVVEPTQKCITHYNSMRGTTTGIRACEDLKGWVAAELGKDFKEEEWTLAAIGESPQQTNSDDCGVFTITSARQIMLGYTPMSYGPAQIPVQRIRIVAELINKGLLKSSAGT